MKQYLWIKSLPAFQIIALGVTYCLCPQLWGKIFKRRIISKFRSGSIDNAVFQTYRCLKTNLRLLKGKPGGGEIN